MGSVVGSLSKKSVDMASPTAQFVRSQIQSNKVVIFSKTYCPYCTMAKEQFKKLNVPMHVIELESRNDCDEIQDVLGELTGARSVPRCFVDGKFIGGGTDVKTLYETGKLKELVA
ncbi:uncharacterized protein LOC129918412 [Episyrphus balteatus]|uniref:uncharacterized protein LOC129918412 n=1 Tax=Episyrphus balteatus TaxID=286459 RepID=UPI0024864958|nr:uncharacterized protein LOC129918412 [Episyrphus balteatus]